MGADEEGGEPTLRVRFLHTHDSQELGASSIAAWESKPKMVAGKLGKIKGQTISRQWHAALAEAKEPIDAEAEAEWSEDEEEEDEEEAAEEEAEERGGREEEEEERERRGGERERAAARVGEALIGGRRRCEARRERGRRRGRQEASA